MSRVRKVISYDRDWISKVDRGVPFTLVGAEKNPTEIPVEKKKKVNFSARTLKSLGELLTIKEAATILKVTDRAVYEWVYAGRLKKVLVGDRSIRIATSDLEEFIGA